MPVNDDPTDAELHAEVKTVGTSWPSRYGGGYCVACGRLFRPGEEVARAAGYRKGLVHVIRRK